VYAAGLASFFLWQHHREAVMLPLRGIYRYRTLPLLLGGLLVMPLLFWNIGFRSRVEELRRANKPAFLRRLQKQGL
jgi:hypothetical protein